MKGMLVVKIDRCLGCKTCELACAVEHSQSKDLQQAIHESPQPRSRVKVEQGASFAVPRRCRHCEDAPCIPACPTEALKRENKDSPVIIDEDLCIGCGKCVRECPFGVISLDKANRLVTKCDLCYERVERGELPACVCACPTQALEFRDTEEAGAGKRKASLVRIERATKDRPARASIASKQVRGS
jgi:carbon-monoxide dehydrogenase iron sulfur subunit